MLRKLIFSTAILLACAFGTSAQSKFWKTLTPTRVNLQYAGSIGFLSTGAEYDLFHEKAALGFHIGYVPENLGGELAIIAIKFRYKPFSIPIGRRFVIEPFNPVFFPSYTLGQNFDLKFEEPIYKKGYYFWSSALRLHLGATTEVKILNWRESMVKSLSIYAEANTNDLYALSWFKNRTSTPFYKMFKLGYGVRMGF